ncbi:MAG: hypothetical protein H6718_04175 [Polyangiaceae bacterium]|nr:hypothetical protein [Polyangiaceae bacterium]
MEQLLGWPSNTLTHYYQGDRLPGAKRRKALEAKLGIPITAWDQPEQQVEVEERQAVEISDNASTAELVSELRSEAIYQLRHLRTADLSPELRFKLADKATTLITSLGKLTGESAAITESKILKSPQWQRIEEAITDALEPYPEALEEVLIALKTLRVERSPGVGGDG